MEALKTILLLGVMLTNGMQFSVNGHVNMTRTESNPDVRVYSDQDGCDEEDEDHAE